METKLSIGVTITSVTPAHTYFKLFANNIPLDQDHTEATRASLGNQLCLRNNEFKEFMLRLKPDVVLLGDEIDGRFMEYWNMQIQLLKEVTPYSPTYWEFVY